ARPVRQCSTGGGVDAAPCAGDEDGGALRVNDQVRGSVNAKPQPTRRKPSTPRWEVIRSGPAAHPLQSLEAVVLRKPGVAVAGDNLLWPGFLAPLAVPVGSVFESIRAHFV